MMWAVQTATAFALAVAQPADVTLNPDHLTKYDTQRMVQGDVCPLGSGIVYESDSFYPHCGDAAIDYDKIDQCNVLTEADGGSSFDWDSTENAWGYKLDGTLAYNTPRSLTDIQRSERLNQTSEWLMNIQSNCATFLATNSEFKLLNLIYE